MRSTWHPAPTSLAGVLAGVWSVQAADDADLSARVLPDGTSCLVFQRDGTRLRAGDGRRWRAASLSGPRAGPFDFTLGAGGRIFIAQLRPAGATTVLGAPMAELADRFEPLDAVVGAMPGRLADRIAGAAADDACVRAIEGWLGERAETSHRRCAVTDAAVAEVVRRAGRVRIDELADRLALSRRHLGRVLRDRVGFAPKLFARITRFDHAVRLARATPGAPWARVAVDAGYADQAHLAREFAELGGIRPRELHGPAAARIW